MILNVSCTGSQCHSPGTQGGVSFASQSSAYSAVKSRVTAGNATGSSFYTLVSSGRMPPSGTKLSSSQLSMISAWINAGAMNN
jgi:predicted CxxxxCH...CXXCH cytochrome family protein